MELLYVTHNRVWLLGWRLHHGLVGTVGAIVSLALVWHDRRDFPFFADD